MEAHPPAVASFPTRQTRRPSGNRAGRPAAVATGRGRERTRACPLPEALEARRLFAVSAGAAAAAAFESIDGTGNNVSHPSWGAAGGDLLRKAPAAYADGVSSPAGASRAGARAISNALCAQSPDTLTNDRSMSAFVYAWGQFLDHDLDLTNDGTPADAFNIPVPAGDPQFDPTGTGAQVIPLNRSAYDHLQRVPPRPARPRRPSPVPRLQPQRQPRNRQ